MTEPCHGQLSQQRRLRPRLRPQRQQSWRPSLPKLQQHEDPICATHAHNQRRGLRQGLRQWLRQGRWQGARKQRQTRWWSACGADEAKAPCLLAGQQQLPGSWRRQENELAAPLGADPTGVVANESRSQSLSPIQTRHPSQRQRQTPIRGQACAAASNGQARVQATPDPEGARTPATTDAGTMRRQPQQGERRLRQRQRTECEAGAVQESAWGGAQQQEQRQRQQLERQRPRLMPQQASAALGALAAWQARWQSVEP